MYPALSPRSTWRCISSAGAGSRCSCGGPGPPGQTPGPRSRRWPTICPSTSGWQSRSTTTTRFRSGGPQSPVTASRSASSATRTRCGCPTARTANWPHGAAVRRRRTAGRGRVRLHPQRHRRGVRGRGLPGGGHGVRAGGRGLPQQPGVAAAGGRKTRRTRRSRGRIDGCPVLRERPAHRRGDGRRTLNQAMHRTGGHDGTTISTTHPPARG